MPPDLGFVDDKMRRSARGKTAGERLGAAETFLLLSIVLRGGG